VKEDTRASPVCSSVPETPPVLNATDLGAQTAPYGNQGSNTPDSQKLREQLLNLQRQQTRFKVTPVKEDDQSSVTSIPETPPVYAPENETQSHIGPGIMYPDPTNPIFQQQLFVLQQQQQAQLQQQQQVR